MEGQITLVCRACKTPNVKETKYFLKFYNKKVKVACEHCGADINLLADDAFFKGSSELKEERTGVFIQNKEVWTTSNLMKVFIEDTGKSELTKASLQEGLNLIGRIPQQTEGINGISINTADRQISRSHCMLTVENKQGEYAYLIKDYDSSNGTYLNGEKLSVYDEVYLEIRDVITIGNVNVMFKAPN